MISFLLMLIILAIQLGCFAISLILLYLAFKKRKNKTSLAIFSTLTILSFLVACTLWNIFPVFGAETEDREKSIEAFEQNFKITPPSSIAVIKHKNYCFADACSHWMAFTYDSTVQEQIFVNDNPLSIAKKQSDKTEDIIDDISKNKNSPDWFELPNKNTTDIYYKENFLEHNHSEYYLWINYETKMVYLNVSYFD